jgi:uncharacterized protein YbbC (DUF1343 family)
MGEACLAPTLTLLLALLAGFAPSALRAQSPYPTDPARVVPGITVLLEDSVGLIRGKRVGLLTNQTGVDQAGVPDAVLLTQSPRATGAQVHLVVLFSPEHGFGGTEDRPNVQGGMDAASGVPVYSLYGSTVIPPPDSMLNRLDVLVIDLQDIGTRTWTYVASMLYSMRSAARLHVPVVVLDRPNPLTGVRTEGPILDSALANADPSIPTRAARPYALAPIPLRHGLTMGELARYYNDVLGVHAELHVMPARGWRRGRWFDETGLPWVRPSPNLPSLASAVTYPALVAFEGSNLSVGRGTPDAFQRFGAPWLDAGGVARMLSGRGLPGVQFDTESFTPDAPTDHKYGGQRIAGVRIRVTDRKVFQAARVGAAILWAVSRTNSDSLRIDTLAFDLRFGSPAAREALVRGTDPDTVIDRQSAAVSAFVQRAKCCLLYR